MAPTPIQDFRNAYGDWLNSFDWKYWTTLTFAYPSTVETASTKFRRYLRWLAERELRDLSWFVVYELSGRGCAHIHTLVSSTSNDADAHLRGAWVWGRKEVERYEHSRGASWYLTKAVGSATVDHDVSWSMPPVYTATSVSGSVKAKWTYPTVGR